MRIIEPSRRRPQPKKQRIWRPIAVVVLVIASIGGAANYMRPLPAPTITLNVTPPPTSVVTIDWPAAQQSAIAAPGYGLLDTRGATTPIATASITKVIASLCVLDKLPLTGDESGPTYTVTAKDVAGYQQNIEQGGSLLPVSIGTKLTERQAIEALMIPSANNISDSLVRWVFGSHKAYVAYATDYLRSNGMNDTVIGSDASGFDVDTVSTASDLTKLGMLALQNPVLMEIAGKKSTVLPGAGRVYNYNTILGVNGITGLKTGNNDANPGGFVFTANVQVGDTTVPVTGNVLGAVDLPTALWGSTKLAASMQNGFEQVTVVSADEPIGTMRTVWGASAPIASAKDVELVRWKSTPVSVSQNLKPDWRKTSVGTIKATTSGLKSEAPLELTQPIAGPSVWWRLTRH